MNLVKWNPFRELEDVSNRLNTLFGRLPVEQGQLTLADWQPVVDISETDNAYLIKAEIPDVEKKDVKVSVHDDMLTLSGERRQEKEENNKKFHRIERSYGSFSRSFRLPPDTDGSTVSAEFNNGMLNVTLPKSKQIASRSIDVNIA
ncbi:MAG TPA: heat-shock protein Hsp20 [Gallionella sp.]|nr:Hsp20/alpha crystallin family protein [Gallionella sp.]OGS67697.1 MAG: heat-shock protein Hsp20 [Gallionellales bacterium GWA2_54_124]OGT18446.1 MAG: heat-shock protein Hsp20 [Gallionellales bacterium RIFOXYD12_FULL_53_10]HCI52549.1 heat-shock protein Hsp20 [Gallionella sp.]